MRWEYNEFVLKSNIHVATNIIKGNKKNVWTGLHIFYSSFINSPAFQRLRRIQQLALTSYIYPGATHTRFEHSLGTMNFASLMFDAIISIDYADILGLINVSWNDAKGFKIDSNNDVEPDEKLKKEK